MRSLPFLVLAAALAAVAPALSAQAPAGEWNSEHALELIQRAQQRRSAASADTGLVNYLAEARVYVYFYLDREDTGERNLVKTDQLALEVAWQAPDRVKQRIVGWRDRKSLPTDINYHLDHLSVVQENFGDEIRLGDGDEVRGVRHPAAPGAERFYDYRLADSLTLRLPGAAEPVRVYELRVRPRDPSLPAFVGSVFVDRRAGDLVRMDFTFTSAAYVDPRLDHINISLDNGLWRGRFWLPNQQRVEIRRSIPQLDIPAGSVIRATMRIGDYHFNEPLNPVYFLGPPVVAAPREQRAVFPFEEGLHAELREEGIGPAVELNEVRAMAEEMVRRQALERMRELRLRLPSASEVLRYNRAEGLAVTLGVTAAPAPRVRLQGQAGWSFGAEQPILGAAADFEAERTRTGVRGYLNRPREMGVGPVASGVVNTLAALFAGRDYTDLFFARGGEVWAERTLAPRWTLRGALRAEQQDAATLTSDFSLFGDAFRPVLPADETDLLLAGSLGVRRDAPAGAGRWWTLAARAEAGTGEFTRAGCAEHCGPTTLRYWRPQMEVAGGRRWGARSSALALRARAGAALGDLPAQQLYLLGGRGTLPGYPFRAFVADRYLLADATLSAELLAPWVRGRLLGAAGWGDLIADPTPYPITPMPGLRASLGAGVGLVHDILRVDVARGLGRGGRWELIVEVNRSFWDFL